MKTALIIASMLLSLTCGVAIDRLFLPEPPRERLWMPIKLTEADLVHIAGLKRAGATYTRFAKLDGSWGIVAVRQTGGVWVVPCTEVGPKVSGGKE